jgi:cytochrome c peroxidase
MIEKIIKFSVLFIIAFPSISISREPVTPLPDIKSLNLNSQKIELGKILFHETRLSKNDSISCATCHSLDNVGSLPGHKFSMEGISGKTVEFNTPTVFNSGFNFVQFWDGRVNNLEDQIDGPITNDDEMSSNWPEIISKLSSDEKYLKLFKEVFNEAPTEQNIKSAIAEFEKSLVTPSRFDKYLKGEVKAITKEELEGYQLFKKYGCVSCHQGKNIGGNMFQKFGIIGNYYDDKEQTSKNDLGRFNVTGKEEDKYVFKVPSLRNVALTPPYFHDGSVETLEEAIKIMGKYQVGVEISDEETKKIKAFLESLNGENLGEK